MSARHDRQLEESALTDMTPQEFPMGVALQIAHGTADAEEIREATCLAIYGFLICEDMPGLVEFFNQMNAALDMRSSATVASVERYIDSIGDEMMALLDADGCLVWMNDKPAVYSVRAINWVAEWAIGTDCGTIQ